MSRSPVTKISLVAAAIAGLAWFYIPYLSTRFGFAPWGDTVYLTGPLFCEISRNVGAGITPLMNWSTFEALDYNPHVATYYPFYLFNWLDFCSPSAAVHAADVIAVLHVAIFAATMTSLICATGAGTVAAVGGAALTAALPNTFALMIFPTFITAVAWLPLATEGLTRVYYRRELWLGALLLAIGASAMLTAGPGTNLLSALVFVGLVMTVDVAIRIMQRRDIAGAAGLAGALAAAAVIIAVLSLASTINLFSHLAEIIRWTRSGAVVGQSGTASISEILTEQLSWRDLPQLLVPINVSYAAGTYLIGPAAALLALLGAVRRWSEPVVRAFAILVVVCVVIVFLSPARVVLIWAFMPGLSHTRHLSLVATPLALGIGVLAGHGLAILMEQKQKAPGREALIWAASALVLTASVTSVFSNTPLKSSDPTVSLATIAAISAALFAALATMEAGRPRQIGAAALLALQFAYVHGGLYHFTGTPAVAVSEPWRSVEEALRQIRASDPNPGRIAMHPSVKGANLSYLQAGSAATYLDMPTFSHYTSPRIFWKFKHEIGLVGDSGFGPFGGKYLLSSDALPDSLGKQVSQVGNIRVYLLAHRRPFVESMCTPEDGFRLPSISSLKVPIGQLPLLDAPQTQAIAALQDGSQDCLAPKSDASMRIDRAHSAIDFEVPPGQERLLVISAPPYAAWQLWVGDRRLPLYNLRQQELVAVVPADVSGLAALRYQPEAYKWRLRISEVAWALVILALAGTMIWRSRHPNRAGISQGGLRWGATLVLQRHELRRTAAAPDTVARHALGHDPGGA
jgi:hypothetical protein